MDIVGILRGFLLVLIILIAIGVYLKKRLMICITLAVFAFVISLGSVSLSGSFLFLLGTFVGMFLLTTKAATEYFEEDQRRVRYENQIRKQAQVEEEGRLAARGEYHRRW